ncbi:hypothetical protein L198_05723 [Cryptococcus wingfieldii CBS 7118]|uniref:ATP-dependent DNA helicase n=1 Tax=Cryptococcus wingfieldii CBS 7118 TaxID=1295528 RepID=A0A1E3IWH3_9TREE|nr:hypothetical protein L198_05723 [Cryptococcus wingfieldii CBS 7118]ODN92051.1 hypothetical protein L198_05723 [Cryptococcus wingfieldii CBS 7118]
MSDDDYFGDDDLFLDDSFLRQVDTIAAKSIQAPHPPTPMPVPRPGSSRQSNGIARAASLNEATASGKGTNANGVQRTYSAPGLKTGPASKAAVGGQSRLQTTRAADDPSSDDYGAWAIPEDALAAVVDEASSNLTNAGLSYVSANSANSASKRNTSGASRPSTSNNRTTSGPSQANRQDGMFQTHLNWRPSPKYTEGKRWDRTAFAKTGRRLIALPGGNDMRKKAKGKGKAKARDSENVMGWDEDEEDAYANEEDEEDMGGMLAPPPKSNFDLTKPYGPQKHLPNSLSIKEYIYPTNRSKRDYQFEIIRNCFMDNTLVALPTGLGKTFVAGVVMLNYYRWFPTGKILFLAPTKPLVAQQIEACQMSCGIPSKDAAVMTGQSGTKKLREHLWEQRRVFYCTPQTVENDLKNGIVDPKDIVLTAVDEAHKATGNFAYTTILSLITAHHPYFRVLALTATPGADVEKVQNVVDALHISRIEIREAEAPEIRKYMNTKHIERHIISMTDTIVDFRDRLGELMVPIVKKLVDKEVLTANALDVKRLRPFAITAKRAEFAKRRQQGMQWVYGPLGQVEKMARAMQYLLEFSLGMFATNLGEILTGKSSTGKKANTNGGANSLANNFAAQRLQRDVDEELNSIKIGRNGKSATDRHPKMAKTLELLMAHFAQAEEEETTLGQKNDTRAMVFCSFRPCVLEIVDMLNENAPLLKATKFVGQSDRDGDKGFNQKEQKKAISDFKEGKFNVLVATAIGEEGLDIGEVDFVVLYDMPRTSIKLLQRIGRTGRKRDGHVHVLMSENREDCNWDTAQQTHRDIQEEILHSRNLELFEDVEPLLPDRQLPGCKEQEMAIDEWNPDDQVFKKTMMDAEKEAKKASAKGTKGKRQNLMKDEVPDGATGFKSVKDLLKGKSLLQAVNAIAMRPESDDENEGPVLKKSKAKNPVKPRKVARAPSPIRSASEDDIDDQTLEALFAESRYSEKGKEPTGLKRKAAPVKRADSRHAKKGRTSDSDLSLPRPADLPEPQNKEDEADTARARRQQVIRAALAGRTPQATVPDIGSDSDIEALSPPPKAPFKRSCNSSESFPSIKVPPTSTKVEDLDFFHPAGPRRRDPSSPAKSLSPSPKKRTKYGDDDQVMVPSSSPASASRTLGTNRNKLSPGTAAAAGFSQIDPIDLSWDLDDDSESAPLPMRPVVPPAPRDSANDSFLPEVLSDWQPSSPPRVHRTPAGKVEMPPPPVPSTTKPTDGLSSPFGDPSGTSTPLGMMATQFPVRRLGVGLSRKRLVLPSSDDASSPVSAPRPGTLASVAGPSRTIVEDPDSSPMVNVGGRRGAGRLKRRVYVDEPESSPPAAEASSRQNPNRRRTDHNARGKRVKKKNKGPRGAFIENEVELSGSDSGDTSEHSTSSVASSSDLRFANDFAPTQAQKGYNQQAMYRAGLGTQARGHGLAFRRDFAQDKQHFMSKAKKPVYITDDEDAGQGRSSENEYEFGSFVVDDDEDVDYACRLPLIVIFGY